MTSIRRSAPVVLSLLGVLVLVSCAPTPSPFVESPGPGGQAAGFLLGLWHGFILLFTFLASLFMDTVGLYEVHNTGWSYNLGFLLGVSAFFSGSGGAAGRRDGSDG